MHCHIVSGIGMVTMRYGEDVRVCVNSDKAAISKEELNFLISQIVEEVEILADDVAAKEAETLTAGEDETTSISHLPSAVSYEDSFQPRLDSKNSLKHRFHNSISTLRDSLSKFREP